MDAEAEPIEPAAGPAVRWGLGLAGVAMLALFGWPSGLTAAARDANATPSPTTTMTARAE